MKKAQVILAIGLLVGLLFSTAGVFAGSSSDALIKPNKTPGAKATDKASEFATEGKGPHGKKVNYKGVVAAAGAGSLTVTLGDGSSVTFTITDGTQIQVPSLGKSATLADLNVGVRVMVQATKAKDGSLTALRIHVAPGKPEKIHRVGTVTAYAAGVSITIQAGDGQTYTFALTADTKILPADRADQLAVGSFVTIISRRDVTGGVLTAQGIVVHPTKGEGTGTPGVTKTPKPTEASEATETPEATEAPQR